MAAVSTIAMVGLAASAVGTVGGLYMQSQANSAARDAAGAQRRAAGVSVAQNAAQASAERRQQVREERIKRAQILNSATNTGVSDSSGEQGALSGMGTHLGANLGANQASVGLGRLQSGFLQQSANAQTRANQYGNYGNLFGQVSGMGNSLFSSVGGWGAMNNQKKLF